MRAVTNYALFCSPLCLILLLTACARAQSQPAPAGSGVTLDALTGTHNFVVEPGGSETLRVAVRNAGNRMREAHAVLSLTDVAGKPLRTQTQDVRLAPNGLTRLDFVVDTNGLAVGEYPVSVSVLADKQTLASGEHALVVAGREDLFIVFDREPLARGIQFDPNGMYPAQIEVGGVKRWVWRARDSHGGEGYWHSALFTITDARFQAGKRPVADIAVTHRHQSDSPAALMADTREGSRQVGIGWGRNPDWQRMDAQVDNAVWQARPHQLDPKLMLTNGCDLRFNSCNDEAELRSIFIHAYDLDNPNYRRLLRFDGLDAGRELFLFTPGEKQTFALKLRNLANKPLSAAYKVRLLDDLDAPLWTRNETATVPANAAFRLPVAFDTQGLKQGVYSLALALGEAGSGAKNDLLASQVNLMVSERSPLARAKPGEFLYGLDSGVGWQDERFLQWADFMGVDILRGMGTDNPDEFDKAFAMYDKYHLTAGIDFGPPWDADPARLQQRIEEVATAAGKVAKRYANRFKYYELGNEPDLPFFYPGPMASYVQGSTAIARAIKENDPTSVVMNGGLSFAGEEGYRRSCEFVEQVPFPSLDAFAYHGHGPGAAAERSAYERMRAQMAKYGKTGKPLIETESGVSAHTPAQVRMQARTAIEKLVYAQSVGLPTFYWFRLFITGGDGDYTNLLNAHEPRSTVLAYRTMVKTLRGQKFLKRIDLGADDYEGYLFGQAEGDQRTLVWWANARGGARRTVALADKPGLAHEGRLVDMFGNSAPAPETAGGTASLTVSGDPQFFTWHTANPAFKVAILPSPLSVAPLVNLLPGGRDAIRVVVKNGSALPLKAVLDVTAGAKSGVTPAAAQMPVAVAAHASTTVTVPVTVGAQGETLTWPRLWTAFLDVPADSVNLAAFTTVPEKIEVKGKSLAARPLLAHEGKLDFAAAAGFYREKAEAVVFAEVVAPRAQTVRVGATADWWMAWYVNGKPVFDTLEAGNKGGADISDHQFDLPLRAGKNLLAVRVLSGSQGWKLTSGGPDELAGVTGSGPSAPERVTFALRQGSTILANEATAIARIMRIAAPEEAGANGATSVWNEREPDGTFGDGEIVNLFASQPDSSRWWHGLSDMSGRVWLRADAATLYVVVGVRDDVHVPAKDAAGIDAGDAIRIALADASSAAMPNGTGKILDVGVPGHGGGAFLRGANGTWTALSSAQANVRVERVEAANGGTTWYRLALSRSLLPGARCNVNVRVNDNDGYALKQYTAWRVGFEERGRGVEAWYPVLLP